MYYTKKLARLICGLVYLRQSIYALIQQYIIINLWGLCFLLSSLISESVLAQCRANFTSPEIACVGETTRFTNTSSPDFGLTFFWDFGDGTATTTPNPQKVFSSTGFYTVKLSIFDSGDNCQDSITKVIQIIEGRPGIGVSSPPNLSGCGPRLVEINISDTGGNDPSTIYEIDFGDGSEPLTFTHPPPNQVVYNYQNSSCPGSFTIELRATNACGSSLGTIFPIDIYTAPQAAFDSEIKEAYVGSSIRFTNETIEGFNEVCNNATRYKWDFGVGSPIFETFSRDSVEFTFLESGIYQVSLSAINTCGSSTFIENIFICDSLNVNPSACLFTPTSLIATQVGTNEIELNWQDNALSESGFIIERASLNDSELITIDTVDSNITNYTARGLNPNTLYFFQVRAFNEARITAPSGIASASTSSRDRAPGSPPLPHPSGLVITRVSHDRIDIAWQDRSDNESGFVIYLKEPNIGFRVIDTTNTSINFYESLDLTPDTRYSYFVRAYDELGVTGSSNIESATTLIAPPVLLTPSSLQAFSVSSNRIDLNWKDNSDNEEGFIIERLKESDSIPIGFLIAPPNIPFISDQNLDPQTTYFYRVRAFADSDTTVYSNWSGATTKADVITTLEGIEVDKYFKIYPNPNRGFFELKIQTTRLQQPLSIVVCNIWGQKIKSILINTSSEIQYMDLSSLPSGIYYLHLKAEEGTTQIKMIKY